MNQFVKVAQVGDFAVRRSRRITIDGAEIALFAVSGTFYAAQNDCPHQHHLALHEGILRGNELTCPMHGWTFYLLSGRATIGGGRLKRYEVKVVGDDIFLAAPDGKPEWAKM